MGRSFGKPEQSIIALLHLFDRAVSVPCLADMFGQEGSGHLPEVAKLKEFQELKDDPSFLSWAALPPLDFLAQEGTDRYTIHEAFPMVPREAVRRALSRPFGTRERTKATVGVRTV